MPAPMHDYTRDDVPFGSESPEDFIILGSATAATTKTADDIEKENSFLEMPAGEHLVVIAGFVGAPEEKHVKVVLDGRMADFVSHSVLVRFALPDNPKCTITDFFMLPPANDSELKAYFEGVPIGKKAAGWAASKFIHFINRIGFLWAPGQPFPDAARKLGSWKGRAVILKVDPPTPYKDDKGEEKMGRPQVKSFSYRPANSATVGSAHHSAGSASHSRGSAAQPAMVAAAAGASNGLDDI